ncbi:MAG TPA: UDP-N-acetylmuramate--L-alanine ligase [Anaerolineales bacterium]|nr:UDP-N-acetylmuramate--L-alanine ligase [Anaerolineales bacterium]
MEHIHFIGIGGTGLSAIARVLHESGQTVSGSDRALSPLAAALRADGVTVHEGHAAANINGATVVVRSSAIPDTNIEVEAARARGIPVLKRADFLGQMMEKKTGIAIAGTHGKTTTTSMIAWMLTALGLDPTFISGGVITNLGTNARAGKGPHFVIEADEYDRMFLGLRPKIAIVTNVEHDHPDCFPTSEDFFNAFREFIHLLPPDGTLIACADDGDEHRLGANALLRELSTPGLVRVPYGLSDSCLVRGRNLTPQPGSGFQFDLYLASKFQTQVTLQVPGQHNVLNALATLSVAHILGLPLPDATHPLNEFRGAGRRFEIRGEVNGVLVVDDYAHHPTEIRATLAAARARYPARTLWVVWQPHTFSRIQTLSAEFAASFENADHVIVTDVYASRETAPDGFTLQPLLEMIDHPAIEYIPALNAVSEYLIDHLHSGDVLLVLSAGDADQISQMILERAYA